jgi:hypothetical protein
VDDGTTIKRIDRLKSVIVSGLMSGKDGGTLACPSCPNAGTWRTEPRGRIFSCEECNVRVDGRLSSRRSAHQPWTPTSTAGARP